MSRLGRDPATAGGERGFALVSAIFLIVILAALAAFITVMSTHQQVGHAADIQGVRAYQAARAGLEWGLYNYRSGAPCAGSFGPGGGLAGFTVTVTCAETNNDEAGGAIRIGRIVATACNQPAAGVCPSAAPGNNYLERRLSVVLSR